jgi:large subunit ribosomal protein L9
MRSVKLILREEVPGLGDAGDLVNVKVGHARNYLLPQGKAILATESKIRELAHHQRVVTEKLAKELKDLGAVRDRLQALDLEVTVKAGEEGKLFGSVTTAQIAGLLAEKGFKIDRRKITLSEPIKAVGEHAIPVRLRKEVVAEVRLKVIPEETTATAE